MHPDEAQPSVQEPNAEDQQAQGVQAAASDEASGPDEANQAAPEEEVPPPQEAKQLDAVTPETAKAGTPDIEVFGDPNAWLTLSKASSKKQGWMKSTKAMFCGTGALVQVSTHQAGGGPGNSQAVAEAIVYVPDVVIEEVVDKNGKVQSRRLVPRKQAVVRTISGPAATAAPTPATAAAPAKRAPWGSKKKTKVAKVTKKSPWQKGKKKANSLKAASHKKKTKKTKRRPWGSVTRNGKPVGKKKGKRA